MNQQIRPSWADSNVYLKYVNEPLYSCAVYDSAAHVPQLEFFNYTVNQLVSGGALLANYRHTNMTEVRRLPHPQVFRIDGVGVHIWPVQEDGATPLDVQTEGAVNCDMRDLMLAVAFASRLEIKMHGDKTITEYPLFFFPSCTGLKAGGDTDYDASDAEEKRQIVSPTFVGERFDLRPLSLKLLPGELFTVFQRTRANISGLIALDFVEQVVLYGERGRQIG